MQPFSYKSSKIPYNLIFAILLTIFLVLVALKIFFITIRYQSATIVFQKIKDKILKF